MWPSWSNARGGWLLVALGWSGCSTPAPPVESPPIAAITQAWPFQIAFDSAIPDATRRVAVQRWMPVLGAGSAEGGEVAEAPFEGPDGEQLRARSETETRRATRLLLLTYGELHCRLARHPGSFGADVPFGDVLGARWCDAVGRPEPATAIRSRSGTAEAALPPFDPLRPLDPVLTVVHHAGETLEFRFLRPEALGPEVPASTGATFGERVGTSCWWPSGPCPGQQAGLGAPEGAAFLAEVERSLDLALRSWAPSLASAPLPPGSSWDESTRSSVLRGVERALHADAAWVALDRGQFRAATTLFESAVAASGAESDEVDVLLLAGLARARVGAEELERAARGLRALSARPAWAFARDISDAAARLSVVPSPADSEVRR